MPMSGEFPIVKANKSKYVCHDPAMVQSLDLIPGTISFAHHGKRGKWLSTQTLDIMCDISLRYRIAGVLAHSNGISYEAEHAQDRPLLPRAGVG